jgi:hypothetical protein
MSMQSAPYGSPGERVAAGADRERQPRGARGADGGGDVVGVARVGDRGRAAVDRAVPAGAGGVVAGVALFDEAAGEALVAERERERRSGGDGGGHGEHDPAARARGRRASPLSATPISG